MYFQHSSSPFNYVVYCMSQTNQIRRFHAVLTHCAADGPANRRTDMIYFEDARTELELGNVGS